MICVHANVAVKWVLHEVHSDRATRLAADAARAGVKFLAPPLFRFELTNMVRQRMIREGIGMATARELVESLIDLPVTLSGLDLIHGRALEIADQRGLRATHDAHYVALAEALDCDLWTADEQLVRDLGGGFPFVRSIADYPIS